MLAHCWTVTYMELVKTTDVLTMAPGTSRHTVALNLIYATHDTAHSVEPTDRP